ncbi:MAG TPA: hypothetical protein VET90_09830, partial [Candidatus Binatus sp.]|nr:hypothetical protein [Candidatus Binatus sp.]
DGRRIAYGRIERGTISFVVDGVATPAVADAQSPTFSPDGSRFVYFGKAGRGLTLMGEGITAAADGSGPGGYFDSVGPLRFSRDGRRLAILGFRGKGRLVLVVDGTASSEYAEGWGHASFSPDGQHVALLVQRRPTGFLGSTKGTWTLLLDGREIGSWDGVSSSPHFSPDGAHVAFSAKTPGGAVLVLDGRDGPARPVVSAPVWSESGRVACVTGSSDKGPFRIVVDGQEGPELQRFGQATPTTTITFTPDGRDLIAIGFLEGGWRPIVGDLIGPGYEGVAMARIAGGRVEFSAFGGDALRHVSTAIG